MNSMRADQLRSEAEWIKKTVWCFGNDGNQVKKYGRRQASIREYQNMRETNIPWLFLCWPGKASRCTGKCALTILSSKKKVELYMLKMYCKEGTSVVLSSKTLHSFIHSLKYWNRRLHLQRTTFQHNGSKAQLTCSEASVCRRGKHRFCGSYMHGK